MKYHKTIDDIATLNSTEDNVATMQMDDIGPTTVKLASDEEATKLGNIQRFILLDHNLI